MSGAAMQPESSHDSVQDARKPHARDGIEMIGRSPAFLAALDTARRVAETRLPVLIVGETGTGKELVARYIHQLSGRPGNLVDVDCGAIPSDLIEALLFGHRRGAFTGAVSHTPGLIELSDNGTLFLDELGSLPPQGQAKLLRVLETGEVRRVGGTRSRVIDFRVVGTMQEDARELLERGDFRLDLMQRIAGVVVRLPPLAERPADVLPLARYFALRYDVELTSGAELRLAERSWPGNVRELRWTIERAALFSRNQRIDGPSVDEALDAGPGALFGSDGLGRTSRLQELRAACANHRGDPDRVAAALGIGRSTLYRWLREARLELRAFKGHAVT